MADALSKAGSNQSAVRAVCLGLSGVNHTTDRDKICNWLRFAHFPLNFIIFIFLFAWMTSSSFV